MKYKIISCQVFQPYLELLQITDVEYIDIKQHEKPKQLNKLLQTKINQNQNYSDIYLLYGICGNAILNLTTTHANVHILKVHDCLSVLLGGEKRRQKLFGYRPSQSWNCATYTSDKKSILTNFELLYGKDNAQYLMNTLYPNNQKIVYINFDLAIDKKQIELLQQTQKIEIINGDLFILKQLQNFKIDTSNFLTLKPNQKIEILYNDQIIKAKNS